MGNESLVPLSVATNVAGTASSIIGDIANISLNAKNYQNMVDMQNYQKQLQTRMFEREDSAVQRRVADLKAAGINPVLAAGQAAEAGPVVSVGTPERSEINLRSPQQMVSLASSLAEISRTEAQTKFLEQQTLSEAKKQKIMDQTVSKLTTETGIKDYDLEVRKSINPGLAKLIDVVEGVVPGISQIINLGRGGRIHYNKGLKVPKPYNKMTTKDKEKAIFKFNFFKKKSNK